MNSAPNHRWFRYSLRTQFVAVTAIAVFLGWRTYCLNWIRQRQEWMEHPPSRYLHAAGNGQPAPWQLRLFGETQGWQTISMRFSLWDGEEPELNDEQLALFRKLQRLFPEAVISTSPLDSRRPQKLRTVR